MSNPKDPSAPVLPLSLPPPDRQLIDLFVGYLIASLQKPGTEGVPAATLEVIRKVCQDNAITISSVRRGDFGTVAAEAAENFPFNDDGRPTAAPMMTTTH